MEKPQDIPMMVFQEETGQPILYGYSVMTSQYALKNGLSVGMSKSEIFAKYTNLAEADFDGGH